MTTHGEKVCQFIERYFLIPEGSKDGQPINVLDFQSKFVLDVYNNPACTSLAWYNDRVYDCSVDRPRQNGRSGCCADMMYGSLSALVGAYFGFSGVAARK